MGSELAEAGLLAGLLSGAALLEQGVDGVELGGREAGGRVVILVEVNLAEQEHVLAPYQEDAVRLVGVQALGLWVVGICRCCRREYALGRRL